MQLTRYEKEDLVAKIARVFADLDQTSFGFRCYGTFSLKKKEEYAFERFNNFSHKWRQETTPDPRACGDLAFTTSLLEIIAYAKNLIEERKNGFKSGFQYYSYQEMLKQANDALKQIDDISAIFLELDADKKAKAALFSQRSGVSRAHEIELESASNGCLKDEYKSSLCRFGLFTASVAAGAAVVGFAVGLSLT